MKQIDKFVNENLKDLESQNDLNTILMTEIQSSSVKKKLSKLISEYTDLYSEIEEAGGIRVWDRGKFGVERFVEDDKDKKKLQKILDQIFKVYQSDKDPKVSAFSSVGEIKKLDDDFNHMVHGRYSYNSGKDIYPNKDLGKDFFRHVIRYRKIKLKLAATPEDLIHKYVDSHKDRRLIYDFMSTYRKINPKFVQNQIEF